MGGCVLEGGVRFVEVEAAALGIHLHIRGEHIVQISLIQPRTAAQSERLWPDVLAVPLAGITAMIVAIPILLAQFTLLLEAALEQSAAIFTPGLSGVGG